MSNLNCFFHPEHVAVIGASRSPEKVGYSILNNLVNCGYKGKIYPINPREKEILGLKCYQDISQVGSPVDLAIIAIPEKHTVKVVQSCGEAGVKGLIVITAGFKEVGNEGAQREEELIRLCRKHNMRLLGPNCVGLIDTHTPVNGSFSKGFPKTGNVSFISQSGAMLVSIIDWSTYADLGFSRFISLGNKADLDEVDFIECCAEDPNTNAILVYIEDINDGDKFIRVCTEASKKKPIIVLKSGVSEAGAQAASSHTGALAGSDQAYDTAFQQCGVIRVDNMDELFDLAKAFATQPLPGGDRVAIVTNAGGPAIVATDAIEEQGLKMARFEKDTIDAFQEHLPAESNIYNPVDILGDAKEDRYRYALEKVLSDKNTDSVLVLLTPTAVAEPEKTAQAIIDASKQFPTKPVFAVYMGGGALKEGRDILTRAAIPTFTFPEPSVKTLKGMIYYSGIINSTQTETELTLDDINQQEVKATLRDVVKDRRAALLGHEASRVLSAYGIPSCQVQLATSAKEAGDISDQLGYPVVLKISSPKIAHKTDVGGVEIGLKNRKQVEEAFDRIMDRAKHHLPDAPLYGVEVSNMAEEGTELIIGLTRDVQFGPLIV
ncbi:MAG TPA: acetate--CoA ligase, partial [Firmicutes bacterium]|nr:acetate--CoA ligase [Bacillota bacterium]